MTMRTLYHIEVSTFSRRVRLVLAHKGLEAELRDCRADPANLAEMKRLSAIGMMPVLVDDGHVVPDSGAIAHYLDDAYPDTPRVFPREREALAKALAITSAIEFAMTTLVDVGAVLRAEQGRRMVRGLLGAYRPCPRRDRLRRGASDG